MKKSKLLKRILIGLSIFVLVVLLAFTGLYIYIKSQANQYAKIALKEYPEETEKVFAMVKYINDDSFTLKERNHMVWAIGTLQDKRARPYLQEIYTGKPCKHSEYLCQRELEKAINKCGGSVKAKN